MSNSLDILDYDVPDQGFIVDSMEDADWCVDKVGKAEANIERYTALARDYKKRIDERLEKLVEPHQKTIAVMTSFLTPWANTEIARLHNKKSIELPSGRVGFRSSTGSLEITDEVKAITWLEGNGHVECVKTEKTIRKDETKKLIKATGEVPDGLDLKSGATVFYVDPVVELLEKKK